MTRKHNRLTNRLMALFAANADKTGYYSIESSADGTEATVYIYQPIGSYYGLDPEQFVRDFAAIDAQTIRLRMHTPGGDVFAARAMTTALMSTKAKVIAQIDGLVASAGTYVAMAADKIEIVKGGFMMIHNAWTLSLGDHHEMRKTATVLEKISGTIADDYAARAERAGVDLPRADIVDMMDNETWLTAQECLDNGFVDAVFDGTAKEQNWDLSAYEHPPEALAHKPKKEPASAIEQERAHRAQLERRMAFIEATA